MISRFGMIDCKPIRTSMEAGTKFDATDDSDSNGPSVPFRELLGSLMYLAQGTRPDIAHAVSALSQWNTSYSRKFIGEVPKES